MDRNHSPLIFFWTLSRRNLAAIVLAVFVQLLRWSSGYDARLTRERSPVQSRDEVSLFLHFRNCILNERNMWFREQHWSSGYDVRLTRGRSPVQSWDAVSYCFFHLCWHKSFYGFCSLFRTVVSNSSSG